MKLPVLTILLFALSVFTTYGQELILSEKQNKEWLNRLRESPLDKQLFLIKARILADTNVYVNTHGDRAFILPDKFKNRLKAQSSPIFLFELSNRKTYMYSDMVNNYRSNAAAEQLSLLLTTENIKAIEIFDEEKAIAQFGSYGLCGMVLLKTNNKKIIQIIKTAKSPF